MDSLLYDGTFEGFLSAVFYVYERKLKEVKVFRQPPSAVLFGELIKILIEDDKAARVWQGLSKKISASGLHALYCSHLADTLNEEDNMLAYIQHAFASKANIETDYSNFAVMRMQRIERMVHREKHRMEAFIRFKLTADNIYYATIEPDFNVIPLIKPHFEKRYADQRWLIYDLSRRYGIYYNLDTVENVTIDFNETAHNAPALPMDTNEELYQTLWQQYFKSVNIATRKNMKLHIQHMPKRYWKYLVEKQVLGKEIV